MLFNSFQFVVFLPLVLILYFSFPPKYRWALLLAASYYFYACWKLEYVFLLALVTVVDYIAGIRIAQTDHEPTRKKYLWIVLLSNLGILFLFKYFNFFSDSIRAIFQPFNIFYDLPVFKLALPVGISFYTFQVLGYIIDIYRRKRGAEKHFGIFALYVSFFPQLLSGPIERANRLLPQFNERPRGNLDAFRNGFVLILWGYFQKLVIADRLAQYVNHVYSRPAAFEGAHLMLASILFPFQLYADFAGYTHIAIGIALMMNYRLMNNFNRPFSARSVRDFIFRWHISLTRWIMDYVFFPLSRNAKTKIHGYLVTIFVFSLVGLWHGAAWHFVLFGLSAGLLLVWADIKRPYAEKVNRWLFPKDSPGRQRIHAFLQILTTFVLLVGMCIFFRSNRVSDVYIVLKNMFKNFDISREAIALPGFTLYDLLVAIAFIILMQVIEWIDSRKAILGSFAQKSLLFQYSFCYVLIFSILMFGEFHLLPFIYFQF